MKVIGIKSNELTTRPLDKFDDVTKIPSNYDRDKIILVGEPAVMYRYDISEAKWVAVGKSKPIITQKDWKEEDENSSAYVANKPVYSEVSSLEEIENPNDLDWCKVETETSIKRYIRIDGIWVQLFRTSLVPDYATEFVESTYTYGYESPLERALSIAKTASMTFDADNNSIAVVLGGSVPNYNYLFTVYDMYGDIVDTYTYVSADAPVNEAIELNLFNGIIANGAFYFVSVRTVDVDGNFVSDDANTAFIST